MKKLQLPTYTKLTLKNDYYVGMTRAKENLFLLTEDILMLQNVNS
jgi:ATP-dependent exoDNAse (exonuclease V) beta subunit